MLTRFCCFVLLIVASAALAIAQQPNSDNVRPVPPPGIGVSITDYGELDP